MSIIHFPSDVVAKEQVSCAICELNIPLDKATAGFLSADHGQVFACNAHFWEGNRFILGWVDFAAGERRILLSQGTDPSGGGYAWSVS